MLQFNGPYSEKTPHARLLYRSFNVAQECSLSKLYEMINELDQFVDHSPRIQKAHENIYIYFFGDKSPEYWIGREITGFVPNSVTDYKVFDSYRGEALSWELVDNGKVDNWNLDGWRQHAKQLTSLAGEALAMTWRVEIGPLEMLTNKKLEKKPQISFQFFKTH